MIKLKRLNYGYVWLNPFYIISFDRDSTDGKPVTRIETTESVIYAEGEPEEICKLIQEAHNG